MQLNFKEWFFMESQQTDEIIETLKNVIKDTEWDRKLYIAGGYVRDMLLGKDSKDIDIVVEGDINAGIEAATFIAKKLGIFKEDSNPVVFPRFGTAKLNILSKSGPFDVEFVAPRKEKYEPGSRKPEVSSATLEDDAFRRDFTINSMFQNLTTGEILDLTGKGKEDLKNKIIRTTSDPDLIFREDPLRLLRSARFFLKYNFDLDPQIIEAMKRNADSLNMISKERITDELNKILVLNKPSKVFQLFKDTGILNVILPELQKLSGVTQNAHHIKDAFGHTMDVLDNTPPDLITRLAGLFHDIGKAVTRTEKEGKIQFIGHEQVGEQIAVELMKRLKYSNEDIEKVAKIVRHHMYLKFGKDDVINIKDKHLRKMIYMVADQLEPYLDLVHADNISHSEASSMPNQIKKVRELIKGWNLDSIINTKSILDGNEIMELGAKGKVIGKIKERIVEKLVENPNFSKLSAINLAKNIIADEERKSEDEKKKKIS